RTGRVSLDDRSITARKWRLPSALWIVLILLVYAHPLFTHRTFTGRDQTAYNLPMALSIHDAYARGRLPVWTAEISGGRPLLPNPNVGALYPIRPALSLLPFPQAMRLYPVLHWAAAGIGMILLLTSLGGSQTAAWMGAVTYVFSGVGVSEVFFPHLQPGMTLLPWVLWATGQLQFPNGPGVLGLAFFFTLDFLAADIFTAALAIGCAALWIFFEAARGERRSRFLALGESVGLGVLA